MVSLMISDKATIEILQIYLSNNTAQRKIESLTGSKEQLIQKVVYFLFVCLQLDETGYVTSQFYCIA